MIETLLKIFSLANSKVSQIYLGEVFVAIISLVDISLIIFSTVFNFSKVSLNDFNEILNSRVKKLLFGSIFISDLIIIAQSWFHRKYERKVHEILTKIDSILKKESSTLIQTSQFPWWKIKSFVLLLTCWSLSIVPTFLDKVYGIWEVLVFSILFMKITAFRYTMTVEKIRSNLQSMREMIETFVSKAENLENSIKKTSSVLGCMRGREALDFGEKIVTILNYHSLICQAVSSFNKRFGLSILCLLFSAFLNITYCAYNFFIEIETRRNQNIIIGEQKIVLTYIAQF